MIKEVDYCKAQTGGGIYSNVNGGGQINVKNQSTFTECQSISGNGGGIYSNIVYSSLYIQDASFERCSSIQPGNGGGIALIQGISSIISITNSSFINCETISNSSDQRFGWGGAIFIQTQIEADNLNETNLLLRDLSFTGSSAVNSIGNNIHIQSIDTYATGEAIEYGNLLSVNGTVDLYYNSSYLYDYMGIDESKVEDGTTIDNNIPLFSFHALKTCISYNIPKGCTPLCTIDSNSTIELQDSCFCNQDSHPTNCRCPVDSSQLEGIPTEVQVLPRDEDGYIIWPPENATKLPLFIDNVYIESKQKASFQMNDATWLDSRKKWYGMLISADNETFVGKDGNEDEAIRIDVFVEEGEQFVNFNKNQTSEPLDDSDETDPGKSGRFQFPI
ncbi:MAG: hypothetical protein EZS28_039682, partial [Streblomastix strix]